MEYELPIRLVLVDPPAGIDFGIQKGSGVRYETLFVRRRRHGDVVFDFSLTVKDNRKDGLPNFVGPFAQGSSANRFVYIDVGTYAGQQDTQCARRMKVPLEGITWTQIRQALDRSGYTLAARIPGTGKDGGPNCATVELLSEWKIVKANRA